MPADIEIAAEALERASRRWEEAAECWRAAGRQAPEASLTAGAWAGDLPAAGHRFAGAYQECVGKIHNRLAMGAQSLHGAAGTLRGLAHRYLAIDADSARALHVRSEQAGPADAR